MNAIPAEIIPAPTRFPPPKAPRERPPQPPGAAGGVFREALLCWYPDAADADALRAVGRLLAAALEPYSPARELAATPRLRAIVAEIEFLACFLADGVDERGRSTLRIVDWELAKEAALAARSLEAWGEQLRAEARIRGPVAPPTRAWEDAYGLRESALWAVREGAEGEALRRLGQLLWEAILDVAPADTLPARSLTARQLRAAALDLEHLADFVAETATIATPAAALDTLAHRLTHLSRSLLEATCLEDS